MTFAQWLSSESDKSLFAFQPFVKRILEVTRQISELSPLFFSKKFISCPTSSVKFLAKETISKTVDGRPL